MKPIRTKDDIQSKEDVKEYARLLKNFYGELYTYIIVDCGLILIWLFSGAGYFWPIWVVLVWGIALLIKASKLRVIDGAFYQQCNAFREKMMFLKKDWEDQKVAELLKEMEGRKPISSKTVSVKADVSAVKAPARKNASSKKAPVKKSVSKKIDPA